MAQRQVRIRHSVVSFYRRYDEIYSKYCAEWFSALLPILARHQITNEIPGCLLAVQIENENFETFKGIIKYYKQVFQWDCMMICGFYAILQGIVASMFLCLLMMLGKRGE